MNPLLNCKYVQALNPQSINDTDTAGTAVDTIGCESVLYVLNSGAIGATLTSAKITECATSNGSYSDITGAAWTAATIGTTSTKDNTLAIMQIKCGGSRLRYQKLQFNPGAAAHLVACTAILYNPTQSPNSATEFGATEVVTV